MAEHDVSIFRCRRSVCYATAIRQMNELTRLLELDESSITDLVDLAERRGLVEGFLRPRTGGPFRFD